MLVYQSGFGSPCRPCNRETFEAIAKSDDVKTKTADAREALAKGDKKTYAAIKQTLPGFCFMANFKPNKGKDGKFREDTWRLQSAAVLTGLVMLDYDHIEFPARDFMERIPQHMFADDCDSQVLYVGATVSGGEPGGGVRVVCKADIKRGNLADNQQYLSRIFKMECDKSIKNADRTSFAVPISDIYYLDNQLFTYQNDEYDKMYGEQYRRGDSRAANAKVDGGRLMVDGDYRTSPQNTSQSTIHHPQSTIESTIHHPQSTIESTIHNQPSTMYNGIPFQTIVERWIKQNGAPQPGERHLSALRLAADLRYLCDNDAAKIKQVMLLAPFVQEIISERGEREIDDICTDVVGRKMNLTMPKRLAAVVDTSQSTIHNQPSTNELDIYAQFWERLKPLLDGPYELATYRMEDYNKLGGVFAAGTMFCTLMTRCWYRHFDGEEQRMNPQAYLIGDPASGKGEAEKMDKIIMAPVIVADRVGRDAEEKYKELKNERSTSSKAQKGEALKRPEYVIRYLPSKTSNAVFYRRSKNAVEMINGEKFPLHLYTFDSELDSNTSAQSGGSWIGKHDIELKAFHNEYTGVDFANNDSVNDNLQIFYNSVVSGTPISLARKITPRNVNDGLCSRLAIFKMVSNKYKMIARGNRNLNHEKRCKLQQWAFKFDKLQGELPIKKLVDHVYNLCEESASQAELEGDEVLDYLRKRAVFYAIWFTVPRIMARAITEAEKKKEADVMKVVKVEKSDLDFASLIYDAIIYWQDFFFGRQLQESWDNANRDMKPRPKRTFNTLSYNNLPRKFSIKDVEQEAHISSNAAGTQIDRWIKAGFVKRVERGVYEKIAINL